MKNRLLLLAGVGVGYVLGTRAGRGQYEKLKGQAKEFWGNPTVQDQVANAQRVVREQAPVVQEKVVDVAKSAASKAKEHVPAGSRDDDPTINI